MSRKNWGKLRGNGLRTLRGSTANLQTLKRPTDRPGQSIYSTSRWRTLSKKVRKMVPYCQQCGATDRRLLVDHIHELRDGGEPWDMGNLKVMCDGCHGQKTTAIAKARKRAQEGK